MVHVTEVSAIAHVIQLAVAPVFLLLAIGTMLNVMTNRLARIIDRARVLETSLETAPPDLVDGLQTQLRTLARRANLIGRAITLCTTTALLVCTVVAILFLSAFVRIDVTIPIALLFILAMLAFVLALVWFLQEIFLATANLRIGPP
ncbi:MAG TPA: DUF2721 domain-containing protein [Thermoanaerobaculia bacterium]